MDKTFSVQEDTDKVKVWVKARASVLNKLQSKDFKVVADMRNVTLGNAVPYTLECTSSALTKANWECEPASLKIKIECCAGIVRCGSGYDRGAGRWI